MQKKFEVVSFYNFTQLQGELLQNIRQTLLRKGEKLEIRGLILLSQEGINATLSGPVHRVSKYLQCIEKTTKIKNLFYKRSFSNIYGFKKLIIKCKKEIVNMGLKIPKHLMNQPTSLEAKDWEEMLCEKNLTVLDIRNDYEVEIGKFKKAKVLGLKEFHEFSEKLKQKKLNKNRKTLIYCTGGIRCEKALVEMKKQGFKNYQASHILELLKQMNRSQKIFTFSLLGKTWRMSAQWLSPDKDDRDQDKLD